MSNTTSCYEETTDSREFKTSQAFPLSKEAVDLARRMFGKDMTDDEFDEFIYQCNRLQLDPLTRQIYPINRVEKDETGASRVVTKYQVSIDGFRLIAERTGKYKGQVGPFWCGPDGVWKDVWIGDGPPYAAKVGVKREGFDEPLFAVARYASFAQKRRDGKPTYFWSVMGDLMLAKVAESQALRRAFPQYLSRIYTPEEMAQSYNEDHINVALAVEAAKDDETAADESKPSDASTAETQVARPNNYFDRAMRKIHEASLMEPKEKALELLRKIDEALDKVDMHQQHKKIVRMSIEQTRSAVMARERVKQNATYIAALEALLKDAKTEERIDAIADKWNEDARNVDESTFNHGVELIAQYRRKFEQ